MGWERTATIEAPGPNRFGSSSKIHKNYMITSNYTNGTTLAGQNVYFYKRCNDGDWKLMQTVNGADISNDNVTNPQLSGPGFGVQVDIWDNYAIVGQWNNQNPSTLPGRAYIFTRGNDDVWRLTQRFSGDTVGGLFGITASICGNYAIIGESQATGPLGAGQGAVYIFERNADGNWNLVQKTFGETINSNFGSNNIVIQDNYALISASGHANGAGDTIGKVYLYKRCNSGEWKDTLSILGEDGAQNNSLGGSLGLSDNYFIAGSSSGPLLANGGSYVICLRNSKGEVEELVRRIGLGTTQEGAGVGVYKNYYYVVLDNNDADPPGRQYDFYVRTNAGDIVREERITIPNSNFINGSVQSRDSVSMYGNYLCIGAPLASANAGQVYVYERK